MHTRDNIQAVIMKTQSKYFEGLDATLCTDAVIA